MTIDAAVATDDTVIVDHREAVTDVMTTDVAATEEADVAIEGEDNHGA